MSRIIGVLFARGIKSMVTELWDEKNRKYEDSWVLLLIGAPIIYSIVILLFAMVIEALFFRYFIWGIALILVWSYKSVPYGLRGRLLVLGYNSIWFNFISIITLLDNTTKIQSLIIANVIHIVLGMILLVYYVPVGQLRQKNAQEFYLLELKVEGYKHCPDCGKKALYETAEKCFDCGAILVY